MTTVILIPARYASTRFPGKPLAMLGNQPIIQHVWQRATTTGVDTYVATDDPRIAQAVEDFGGKAIITSADHRSGTDRIAEALQKIDGKIDVVVNVQGDEPFIQPQQITLLTDQFQQPDVDIATLSVRCTTVEEIADQNVVKVVTGKSNNALYFSRSPIPFMRGVPKEQWPKLYPFQKHLGIYAYRANVLTAITQLPQAPLEKAESLEQLRWLQAGYRIRVVETQHTTIGIDTPEDLAMAEQLLKQQAG